MSGDAVRHDVDPEGIPDALKERDTWVCWRIEMRNGKPTKVPYDAETGDRASSTDDATWTDFETALATHRDNDEIRTAGIGFVFSPTGPFVGVDLDKCRDPETGDVDDWARDLIDALGTFAEWSPSDTGTHAIGRGELPAGGNCSGDVEMYEDGRFFTVTGQHVTGTPTAPQAFQDALEDAHAEHITGDDDPTDATAQAPQNGPVTPADLDDQELIQKASAAGNGRKFRRLWNGDTSGYDSHSEARMALLSLLAFWTGGDSHQMDRLYRDSGLHPHPTKPEKWDRLGDEEIEKAISNQSDFFEPGGGPSQGTPDGGATTADVAGAPPRRRRLGAPAPGRRSGGARRPLRPPGAHRRRRGADDPRPAERRGR